MTEGVETVDEADTTPDEQARDVRLPTPRLVLRDVVAADVDTLLRYWAEPESHPMILRSQRDPVRSGRFLRAMAWYNDYAAWQDREAYFLAICRRDDDTVIGNCTARYVDRNTVIVGWHLGIAHAGQGYATEAARALLHFAFDRLGVRLAYADCFASNTAVLAVLRKLGMRRMRPGFVLDLMRGLGYRELRPALRHGVHRDDFLAAWAPEDSACGENGSPLPRG